MHTTQKDLIKHGTWNDIVSDIMRRKIVSLEIADFFLGDYLGGGISRHVFVSAIDPKQVIKIDCISYNANVMEYHLWNEIKGIPSLRKWFAPCYRMSKCGRVLTQKRVATNACIEKYPSKVPEFLTDLKTDN